MNPLNEPKADPHVLQRIRQQLQLSVLEMAQLAHTSANTWSAWELGRIEMPYEWWYVLRLKLSGAVAEARRAREAIPGEYKSVIVVCHEEDPMNNRLLGTVSTETFVGLRPSGEPGRVLVKNLEFDPLTRDPYVQEFKADTAANPLLLQAVGHNGVWAPRTS